MGDTGNQLQTFGIRWYGPWLSSSFQQFGHDIGAVAICWGCLTTNSEDSDSAGIYNFRLHIATVMLFEVLY